MQGQAIALSSIMAVTTEQSARRNVREDDRHQDRLVNLIGKVVSFWHLNLCAIYGHAMWTYKQ
jgi:hypothetical protein